MAPNNSPQVAFESEIFRNNRTGHSENEIRGFVTQYHPNSPVFDSTSHLIEQYRAYCDVIETGKTTIGFSGKEPSSCCVTVASGSSNALEVFRNTAEFLADKGCGIQQALLNDFTGRNKRVAVTGIQIDHTATTSFLEEELKSRFSNLEKS